MNINGISISRPIGYDPEIALQPPMLEFLTEPPTVVPEPASVRICNRLHCLYIEAASAQDVSTWARINGWPMGSPAHEDDETRQTTVAFGYTHGWYTEVWFAYPVNASGGLA